MSESTFLFLTLDLPTAPLYKDEKEQLIIPQVPLFNILGKFTGSTEKVHILLHPYLYYLYSKAKPLTLTHTFLSHFISGVQNLQGEFSQKVPVDQTSAVPHFLHQKIHQEQLLCGEKSNNCQLPHYVSP